MLNAGQSVELDCEFYAETFNMFKNPVVWRKHQRQELTEVNIMGNILQPFLAAGRFVVTFTANDPRYRIRLRITGIRRPSDSRLQPLSRCFNLFSFAIFFCFKAIARRNALSFP